MQTSTFRHAATRAAFVASTVLALVPAAIADKPDDGDFIPDIKVRVKRGNLVITGPRGIGERVFITPTATGLMVQGDEYCSATVNGSFEPFETDEPIRDWRFNFGRTPFGGVEVLAPQVGIPPLTPRNVVFVGNRSATLSLSSVEVQGKVKADFRRSRDGADISLIDTTVAKSLGVRSGTAITDVHIERSVVRGATKIFIRNFGGEARDYQGRVQLRESRFRSIAVGVDLRTVKVTAELTSRDNTVSGNVSLRGGFSMASERDAIGGNLVLTGSRATPSQMSFSDMTVTGIANLRAGARGDSFAFERSNLGALNVRGGAGNDFLGTRDCDLGAGGKFTGGPGKRDRWLTTSDGHEMTTRSVEVLDPNWPPPEE